MTASVPLNWTGQQQLLLPGAVYWGADQWPVSRGAIPPESMPGPGGTAPLVQLTLFADPFAPVGECPP